MCEACHRYLGSAGDVRWHKATGRYVATVEGAPSATFEAWDPVTQNSPYGERREFEVEVGIDSVTVITHHTDEFTVAVADGFAEACARYWKGTLEQ